MPVRGVTVLAHRPGVWPLQMAICMRAWCVRKPRIFEHRRSRVSMLILINLSSRAAIFFSPWEPRYYAHALHVGAWGCAPRCDGSGRVGWDRSECECSGCIGPGIAVRPALSATKSACVRPLHEANRAQMPGSRPCHQLEEGGPSPKLAAFPCDLPHERITLTLLFKFF